MKQKRKIPMVKRETAQQINMSFTKRRLGLFNKATDLCRLYNAQVAILVPSPASSKIYSFGHSSVDAVFDAFLSGTHVPPPEAVDDHIINKSAFCLFEDIKAQETEIDSFKKRKIVAEEELSWVFEEFEKSQSVDLLQAAIECVQILLDKATSKLNNFDSPKLLASGSTSDATITREGNNSPTNGTPNIDNGQSKSDDILAFEPLKSLDDSPSTLTHHVLGQSSVCKIDTSQIQNFPQSPPGFSCDGNNILPTSDTVGSEQWIFCRSPSSFCFIDNYAVPITDNTDCTTPQTIPELGSGSSCNNDNVFPIGNIGNNPCNPPRSPPSFGYDCNTLLPTTSTDDYIPWPLLDSVPDFDYNIGNISSFPISCSMYMFII